MTNENILKYALFIFIFFLNSVFSFSQQKESKYEKAYEELVNILQGHTMPDFKRAVFIVENAYYEKKLEYKVFTDLIKIYAHTCNYIAGTKPVTYTESDYHSVAIHASIFKFMTDTLFIPTNEYGGSYTIPFIYNFDDFNGKKDWSNMFVTKLMDTHTGNCHSLPFLYKIIAEEMGEKAWLSLAPNHIYIKTRNQQHGWYNTELTSATFPTDAYIKASGYIHLDAIVNGIYMDTLSLKESIALCMVDLALGYQRKYPDSYDPHFVLKCCDTALEHFPDFINGLLLQARTRYQIYEESEEQDPDELTEIESMYMKIHNLGYRKMPEEMYLKWLNSMKEQAANQ